MKYTFTNKVTDFQIEIEANSLMQAYQKLKLQAQFKINPHNRVVENYMDEKMIDGFEQAFKNGSR